MVKVKIPASTSNLGSGFDTFGLALQLYLTVEMEITPAGLQIFTVGEDASQIPANKKNLLFQSTKTFYEKCGKPLLGIKIKIENTSHCRCYLL